MTRGEEHVAFEVMAQDSIRRVELALADLRAGQMVILVDDEDRENEGDLVLAAEKVTPQAINFMATHARGLICLSLTGEQVTRLGLSMMATNNQSAYNTAFTVSIEAREGVTTGISASDRAHTTLVAISADANQRHIVTPGHVFPFRARDGGVLERVGQTEGSVDLARLAGLNPSGVICEIMNADGTMSRMPELKKFGQTHKIRIVAVADVIRYRLRHERMVRCLSDGSLRVEGLGTFRARLYQGIGSGGRHLALSLGHVDSSPTLCRVQSAPPSWAALGESRLASTARDALAAIAEEGVGVVVLMHLGPSGPSVDAQFGADLGEETKDPPVQLHADALRDLGTGCQILLDLGLRDLRLLTRSTRAIVGVEAYGLRIVERVVTG